MKKKLIAIVAVLFMTVGTAFSQVIITDEDLNHHRDGTNSNDFGVMVPMQNVNMDQWKQAPLGSGLFLLAGLGAAYLLRKRKEE